MNVLKTVLLVAAAWFAVAFLIGPAIGRRLHRNQPPKGGPR